MHVNYRRLTQHSAPPVRVHTRDVPDIKFAGFRMFPDIANRIPDPDSGQYIYIYIYKVMTRHQYQRRAHVCLSGGVSLH